MELQILNEFLHEIIIITTTESEEFKSETDALGNDLAGALSARNQPEGGSSIAGGERLLKAFAEKLGYRSFEIPTRWDEVGKQEKRDYWFRQNIFTMAHLEK